MYEKNAYEYHQNVVSFLDKIEDAPTRKQAEENFSRLIRSHIREDSFAAMILPPQEITIEDCQISTEPQNEGYEYLVFKEPDARAQFYTFQGTGESEYVYADRLPITIGKIGSRKFEKSEDELLVYKGIGLLEMVEKNAAKEVSTIQDIIFMGFARNAVSVNGLDISSGGAGINKANFIDLLNAPLQNRLKGVIALMTETTFNNFLKQGSEVFGDQLLGEIIVNGYKAKTILGYPVITTIKNDILHDNEVFSFPAPEYLGKMLVLEDTKFTVKKEDGIVSWYCHKKFGMLFVNVNGVARLRLNGYLD